MENQKLPNATAVLILGIASILTCCCYGFISIILGVIGLILANKDIKTFKLNPELYSNYNNIKIGKILCIIGIIIGALYLLFIVWLVATFGWETLQDQDLLREEMNRYFGLE